MGLRRRSDFAYGRGQQERRAITLSSQSPPIAGLHIRAEYLECDNASGLISERVVRIFATAKDRVRFGEAKIGWRKVFRRQVENGDHR